MDWMRHAACASHDPELWFPDEHGGPNRGRRAIEICNTCPVTVACAAYAIKLGMRTGIWAGVRLGKEKD